MNATFKYRILLVDDNAGVLESTAARLASEGYLVLTARDGFEAISVLRDGVPEILVSELSMPNMSGFELLAVVRKRFPGVGVIAWSGHFTPLNSPEGLLADRFLHKDDNINFELVEAIRELLTEHPIRSQQSKPDTAPAWIPRSAKGYVVITCTTCLRSSSLSTPHVQIGVLQSHTCVHCGVSITFRIDANISADPPRAATPREESQRLRAISKECIETGRQLLSTDKTRRNPPRK